MLVRHFYKKRIILPRGGDSYALVWRVNFCDYSRRIKLQERQQTITRAIDWRHREVIGNHNFLDN